MIDVLALAALAALPPAVDGGASDCQGLVDQGLRAARAGRLADAAEAFDGAVARCPGRPEGWIERGGLRFLEARYAEAARDLERALALGDDAYVRNLLASSLHLAGRDAAALWQWNAMGQPTLRSVAIEGLRHTRDGVARREIALEPGQVVTVDALRASRRRLAEVGVFRRISLRALPRGDGTADVEASLLEDHGWAASRLEFAVSAGTHLLQQRARLRYANLGGEGVTVTAEHRWERQRPRTSVWLSWPRPLGLPAFLHAQGEWGRQEYAVAEQTRAQRARSVELSLRRVMGPRAVALLGVRLARLSTPWPGEGAWDGRLGGIHGGLDGWLAESLRHRLDGTLRLSGAREGLGSRRAYARATLGLRYTGELAAHPGASVLAAQWRAAAVGRRAPLIDRFAPGASPEMELPLRGRRLGPEGRIEGTNLEWRRRLVRRSGADAGIVLFYDGGRLAQTLEGGSSRFHDVGAGIRLGFAGGALLRVDYGRGLTDGRHALSFGLGQAF